MAEAKKLRVCGRTGCGVTATHLAGILLRTPRRHGNGEMPIVFDTPLCSEHAVTLALKDVMTDEGWRAIVQGCREARKIIPERGRTSIKPCLIDAAPAAFRDRYVPSDK